MEVLERQRMICQSRMKSRELRSLVGKANRGNPEAAWMLGEEYLARHLACCGSCSAWKKGYRKRALAWLEKAVALGCPDAMTSLAIELTNEGTRKSLGRALELETIAWKQKAFAAAWNAAVTSSLLGRPRQCLTWIRRALREDFPDARMLLGVALGAGYGTKRDVESAMRVFRGVVSDRDADPEDRKRARRFLSRLRRGIHPVVDGSIALTRP